MLRANAQHDAVRLDRVLHRVALAEELRVPRDFHSRFVAVGGGEFVGAFLQGGGGTDRDGGLAQDQVLAFQLGHQVVDDGFDVAGIGSVGAALLRGAHPDEVHIGEGGGFGVARRKAKAPCLDVALQDLGQARLVERHLGVLQRLDLGFVNVYAQHLVAEFSHARRVRRAEVTSANHSHPHKWPD